MHLILPYLILYGLIYLTLSYLVFLIYLIDLFLSNLPYLI